MPTNLPDDFKGTQPPKEWVDVDPEKSDEFPAPVKFLGYFVIASILVLLISAIWFATIWLWTNLPS